MTDRLIVGAVAYDAKVVPDLGGHPRVLPRRRPSGATSCSSRTTRRRSRRCSPGRIDIAWNTKLGVRAGAPRDRRRLPRARDARYRRRVLHAADRRARTRAIRVARRSAGQDAGGRQRATRRRRAIMPMHYLDAGGSSTCVDVELLRSTPTSASTATPARSEREVLDGAARRAGRRRRGGRGRAGTLRARRRGAARRARAVLDLARHTRTATSRRCRRWTPARADAWTSAPAGDGLGEPRPSADPRAGRAPRMGRSAARRVSRPVRRRRRAGDLPAW